MRIEFSQPLLLLIFPAAALITLFIDQQLKSRGRALRRFVTLGMRLALLAALVLALADPTVYIGSNEFATWILIDGSASMRGALEDAVKDVKDAITPMPNDLKVGVIGFGKGAMVEAQLSQTPSFTGLKTAFDESGTNAASALRLAGAMLPDGVSGRIVLLSDGRFEDASSEAALLSARGIAVDTLVFTPEEADDAQLTRVTVPSHAYQNQSFHVTVEIYSNFATGGTLVLSANREPVATREVELRKGDNTFIFQDVAQVPGVVTYEVQLIAQGDSVSQNDRLGAYISVEGAPNILLVEGNFGGESELKKLLTAAGMLVKSVTPEAVYADAEALRKYGAVVFNNVDADALPEASIDALKQYVRTLGRGFVVIGGDSSYALGGYRGSALEGLLPVSIDAKNQMDMPSVALVLVIDKSGSMTEQMFGMTRLELAKEGAARSVEVLTERDSVGVIAFDDTAKWVLPMTKVTDVEGIQDQIATIRPGGGTAFYSPLYEAYTALVNFDAPLKHVIFLTDGEPGDSGYQGIASEMSRQGITLTTVAVGSGANTSLLKQLADSGNGRCYVAGEFDNIPKIFTKETYLITGSYVQNRTFTPAITEKSSLTDYDAFPELTGYLTTTLKSMATASLVSDRDDPILAWWQYGAGRVLCWTSDAEGAFCKNFLAWDEAAAFFGGMVSKVLPNNEQAGKLLTEPAQNGVRIRYEEPEDAELEGAATRAVVLMPDGSEQTAELTEQSPGVYEVEIQSSLQGAYAVRVERSVFGETIQTLEGGMVKPYASEYDLTNTSEGSSLARLSEMTGGNVLNDASELLSGRGERVHAGRAMQKALLILALLLFIIDIALRRLVWERAVYGLMERRRSKRGVKKEKKRKAKPAVKKPGRKEKEESKPIDQTADALLNRREHKKRL